ncbi:(Fe-S)-binding protein [Pseudonocardia sp.]|uniref:(Fe-S)-binding protein n=1 Tax=Pseudonocardia sp. TaxID=60912 RepID=UPI003D1026DD
MTDREIFDHDLLDRCISCGFCLPACPTYALTRDEASSPRGRITLMRALETGTLDADDDRLRAESSFCLGCRACEPVCPAGVQYGQLLEQWRDHQWRGRRRPPLVQVLLRVAERTPLLRLMGAVRRPARTPASPGGPSLMLGCFERALYPGVSRSVRRVLPDVAVPADQGCCGALHAHNGESARGHALAERLGEELPGVIVTTAGGCAAHLASVLGTERVQELSDHLVRRGAVPRGEVRVDGRRARVAIQDSCHLRNGLGVSAQPRELIAAVAEFVAVPGDGGCCGSAGTYSLLRPRDARRVVTPKLDALEAAGVDYVVAVNPGCLRQLQAGLARRGSAIRAVHLADLLAAAAGGKRLPRGVPLTARAAGRARRLVAGTVAAAGRNPDRPHRPSP